MPDPQPQGAVDPLLQSYRDEQVQTLQSNVLAAPSPDSMATSTRLGAQLGVSPSQIDGLHDDAQRAVRARNMANVAQAHPPVGSWANQNPRQAVAASDDHQSLGLLGAAWDMVKRSAFNVAASPMAMSLNPITEGSAVLNAVGRFFGYRPGDIQMSVTHGVAKGVADVATGVGALGDIQRTGGDGFPAMLPTSAQVTPAAAQFNSVAKAAAAAVQAHGRLSQAADMLGGVVPYAAAGEAAPLAMGLSGAGQEADAARAAGKYGTGASSMGIVANAAFQAILGRVMPVLSEGLARAVAPRFAAATEDAVASSLARVTGGGLATSAAAQFAGEGAGKLGEYAARAVGSAVTGAAMQGGANLIERDTVNPQRVVQDKVPESALSMVGLDLMMHAMHSVIGGADVAAAPADTTRQLAQTGSALMPRIEAAVGGLHDASILDLISHAASDSTFKQRDPQGYSGLVRYLGNDAGVENLLVSPEAIRTYQQSDSYDRYSDPFAAHSAAIDEAAASGGDVSLPVEFVLGDLAGTKGFDAIKDSIRLRPDGLTRGEAKAVADDLPSAAKETFDRIADQDRSAQAERDTHAEMLRDLTSKIQDAGFTPHVAATYAEVAVQRAATRATRLGRELQPGDFDTQITRVLPPALEAARKADRLDLAINAMRQGKTAEIPQGKTLLEWIADRGGINDSGGDLKAMGLDKWHLREPAPGAKDKSGRPARPTPIKGRRAILRDFDPRQTAMGGISGEGDFGHDTTLRAAVGEGYFPELAGVEPGELETGALHDAISDELAGRPRYAREPKIDDMRLAGDDLRQMIEGEGRDPGGMSDAEIRKFVADHVRGDGAKGGAAYDQAGETVATVHGDEIAPEDVHGADLRQRAVAWYQEHLRGQRIMSKALDHEVEFSSPKKMRAFSADEEKLRAVAALPAIIEHGELISTTAPHDQAKEPSVKAYHTLRAQIEIGGAAKIVRVTIREANNGHFYYDHVLPENTARNPESPGNKTGTGEPGSYEQSTASGDNFNLHMQDSEAGPRGRIIMPANGWGSGRATIELFQHANLSTLLHEFGHQWLEELRFDAEHAEGSDQLRGDWQAVKDWFAGQGHPIGEDGAIPVEAHELFARGIERYLMEGKAPAKGIAGIFEKVRGWLTNIYRTVAALNSPISPEVRQVFDRLLATDEEIEQQRNALDLRPAFADPTAVGMSEAEAAAYRKLAEGARDQAQADLLAKTMGAIRRQRTAEWNRERAGVRADEAARLEDTPLFAALRLTRETPLDRGWITDRMGEDAPGLLPKQVPPVHKADGAHPDDVAEMAGFDSGQQMLEMLMGAERTNREAKAAGDARSLRNRLIDQATDVEMQRRHGDDPFNDGSIEDEAIAAVNNDLAQKLLEAEVNALARRTGNAPSARDAAIEWARDKVRGGEIAAEAMASAVQRHARAVAKAGREAEKAILAQKWDQAFAAKQRQMLAAALLSEARAAHDEVTKAADAMAKIAKRKTSKTVDQDYLDQAHALLDDVQLGPRSQRSIARQGKWEAWARQQEANGIDVAVPPSFEATIKGTHWTRLPVNEFLALKDVVDQVMHLGRLKQTLLDNEEQRTWDSIFDEAEKAAGNLQGPAPKSMADLHAPGISDRSLNALASFDSQLLRMETVFDWLDGGDSNGVFNRIALKPIAEAQAREQGMIKDYLGDIRDLVKAVPDADRARWDDRIVAPWSDTRTNEPMVLTRQQVIAMALNVGNEGNLQRLVDGYRLNEGAVQDFLNQTLTKGEWQFVQGVWDKIETLWPELSAMERRVNGIAPDKVEPRAFDTPHGPMRGGYYPAVYDSTLDTRAEQHAGDASDLLDAKYTRATTRASATQERADQVSAPLLLDLGVINRHLAEVIHDITHREAVIQAWRFLGSDRVQSAVKGALGPEYAAQFRPWAKSVANSMAMDRAGNEGFGKFLRAARMNVTMVGLGFRATTMLVHTSGLAAGASVIGEAAMGHGLAVMARDPVGAVRRVLDASAEVRGHLEHYERDVGTMLDGLERPSIDKPMSSAKQLVHEGQKFALYGIGWIVQRVSVPVWIGAYDKAVGEGMSDDDAKFAADKAVRYSLGASAPKDLTAVQRGTGRWGEAIKMLTMFYTSMASQYQRQRTFARDVMGADARRPRDVPKLASRAFWGIAMVPLWDMAIRMAIGGSGPDKDEWWATYVANKMLANMLGPIPGARELVEPMLNAAEGHFSKEPSITPLQGIFESLYNSAKDVGAVTHGKPASNAIKDTLTTAGYLTGLVPSQVASSTQFLVDVGRGAQHPNGVRDWITGLNTGHVPKRR